MLFQKEVIIESRNSFLNYFSGKIDFAVILGSGLSEIIQNYEIIKEIKFEDIKHLKTSHVEGHKNKFVIVKYGNKNILFIVGRVHMYEGYSAFEVSLAAALSGELGIENIILTNAAGGINKSFCRGNIMAITDHINLQGASPLEGIPDSSKFTDMSRAYNIDLVKEMKSKFGIKSGIYIAVPGPNYETPSEIKFFRRAGADAVGMSTVMEAIMANYYKMKVYGFSLITNMAAGVQQSLSHSEVVEAGKKGGNDLLNIINFIMDYGIFKKGE